MKIIKSATVIDPTSKWNGKVVDILINRSKIEQIAKRIKSEGHTIIKGASLYVSPSWIDIGTQLNDPGFEHRETLPQTAKCARNGGYSSIVCLPTTEPVLDNKSKVEFIIEAGKKLNLNILPLGALTKDCKGEEMSEILDLHYHGCVGFSDGDNNPLNTGLLNRVLQYSNSFDGLIMTAVNDQNLANHGLIHEGEVSTYLGMKGIPSISEISALSQLLILADYTNGNLCLLNISTKESVKLIQKSLKPNSNIYSTVPYLNLIFQSEDLNSFDTNLKVKPPIRAKDDRASLIKGFNSGIINAITSNHKPLEVEAKDVEFEYASFGAAGLETVFAGLNTYAKNLNFEAMIHAMSIGPRKILKQNIPSLAAGNKADLTIFDSKAEWTFDSTISNSKNNPFLGKNLVGKVLGVIN
jgi:dihydroorotase